MTALDRLIPDPRLVEVAHVDLGAPAAQVWARVRHAALGYSPATRALFALRTLSDRGLDSAPAPADVRLDDMRSTVDRPGFQVLAEDAPREVAVGAIGQVWRLSIPFVHVASAPEFLRFSTPRYIKVAWALRVSPLDSASARLEVEVRVTATDDAAWRKFRRYFRLIGPASRFIRRSLLRALAREFGPRAAAPTETGQRADDRRVEGGPGRATSARRRPAPSSPAFDVIARSTTYRHRTAIVVTASPDAIFRALREVTLQDMKVAWLLGELRYLPSRLAGRMPAADPRRPFLSALIEGGTLVLRDDSPRELITGSAAQLHRVHQRPVHFEGVASFEAFADPRYQKLFMSIRVAPTGRPNEQWLVLEHATRPLSRLSRRRFAPYWRVIEPMGAFVTWQLLRSIRRRAERVTRDRVRWRPWASVRATEDECASTMPGDERIPEVLDTLTHGITIRRPAGEVWPWLVQMGAGERAGWYSYDWLDNGRQPSATRIVPELQHPSIGAVFPALPGVKDGFTLLAAEPGRVLTLGWLSPNGTPEVTWTFVLKDARPSETRLVVRARGGPGYRVHGLPRPLTRAAVRAVHFVMERKQLLGIKERAESAPAF
jgi:hypothetical protein